MISETLINQITTALKNYTTSYKLKEIDPRYSYSTDVLRYEFTIISKRKKREYSFSIWHSGKEWTENKTFYIHLLDNSRFEWFRIQATIKTLPTLLQIFRLFPLEEAK